MIANVMVRIVGDAPFNATLPAKDVEEAMRIAEEFIDHEWVSSVNIAVNVIKNGQPDWTEPASE